MGIHLARQSLQVVNRESNPIRLACLRPQREGAIFVEECPCLKSRIVANRIFESDNRFFQRCSSIRRHLRIAVIVGSKVASGLLELFHAVIIPQPPPPIDQVLPIAVNDLQRSAVPELLQMGSFVACLHR